MTENTDGYNSKYGRLAFEKATENQKKLAMIEKNGAVTEDDEITFSETFGYPEQKCVKYIRFYANREIVKITVSVTSANAVGARVVLNGKCVFGQNPLSGNSFSVSAVCRSGENKLYIDFGENLQKFDVNVSLCGRVKKLEDVALPGYALNDCFSVLRDGKLSLYMYGEGVFTECRSFYGVETGSATYNSSDGLFYIAVRYVTGKNAIYTYDKKLNKVALFDDTLVFKNVAFCFTNNLYLYYASCGVLKVAKRTESGFVTQVFSCKANKFHCSHNYGGSYLYVGNVYGFYTAYKIGDDGAPDLSSPVSMGRKLYPTVRYDDKEKKEVLYGSSDDERTAKTCSVKVEGGRAGTGKIVYDCFPVVECAGLTVGAPNGIPVVIKQN